MKGEALHHFNDVDKALEECVRVLKDGRRLFIYDFDVSTFRVKSICKGKELLGEPGNFFTPQDLEEKLESYGFTPTITKHSW